MNIQLKYKKVSFSPELEASTTSLSFRKDRELFGKNQTSRWATLRKLALEPRESSSRILSIRPLQPWSPKSHIPSPALQGALQDIN